MQDLVLIYIKEPAPLLMWTLVREMLERWWVSVGIHTMHYPDLRKVAAPTKELRELREYRTALEQQWGRPVRIFAYPIGHIGDQRLLAVRQAGYDWAVTTMPDVNTHRSDPYLLGRRNMSIDKYRLVVASETAEVWQFFTRLMYFSASKIPIPSISKTNPFNHNS